jgi:hypothetical protein
MSTIIRLLGQPAWQGAGALVAFIALVLYIWFERNRRRAEPDGTSLPMSPVRELAAKMYMAPQDQAVRYFALVDAQSEQFYYEEVAKCIRNAKESLIRLGKGFSNERRSSLYQELIEADSDALSHGVTMLRIQTGSPVASSWAEGYAKLLEQHPDHFSMAVDLDGTSFNDITLIDPRGHDPIAILLFETSEPESLGPVGRPVIALIITNARSLATSLADQLIKHAKDLPKLNPEGVRDLAKVYTYFAWGVHIATRKMLRDVPDARPLGMALLRGWRRDTRAMLTGPANRATIVRTGDSLDAFDGVAYELSWWGKARLGRLERRAYEETPVDIEFHGQARPAFTLVPLPPAKPSARFVRGSWIDTVVEGAQENDLTILLDELRDAGVPLNIDR